jgi:hypothetical protein
MQPQIDEHELSAYHEAGHTILYAHFGVRVYLIEIFFDDERQRFDGRNVVQTPQFEVSDGLSVDVSGFVAYIMRQTEGSWNVEVITQRIRSREFAASDDYVELDRRLAHIDPAQRARELTGAVRVTFQFLEQHWNAVRAVAEALLATFDPRLRESRLEYHQLPDDALLQLSQLSNADSAGNQSRHSTP